MTEMRPPEIKSLTGLRGVAACFVVVFHFVPDAAGGGPVGTLLQHGYLAVDLFFVLSGFVMALTYAGDFQFGFDPGAYGRFLVKRLGRVYPLYLAATLACAALLYAKGQPVSWQTLGYNLLLVQTWGLAESLDRPGWSISTETAAYLLFPLLTAGLLVGQWGRAWILAGLAAGALLAMSALPGLVPEQAVRYGPLDISGPTAFTVLRCLSGFSLGLLAWRLASVPAVRRIAERRGVGTALTLAAVALLAVPRSDVALVLLFVPLLIALSMGQSAAARLLGVPPIYGLGVLSYSIYLVHQPVIEALRLPLKLGLDTWHVPHAYSVAAALLVPVTLVAAAATYHLIEKPGRALSRSLSSRRPSLPAPGAAPLSAPRRADQ